MTIFGEAADRKGGLVQQCIKIIAVIELIKAL